MGRCVVTTGVDSVTSIKGVFHERGQMEENQERDGAVSFRR